MTASSNYGTTMTFNGAVIGKCIVNGFPQIITEPIDTTNHASGGNGESIPSGLVRMGDMDLTFLEESGTLAAIKTHITNKTIAPVVLNNNATTLSGSGFFLTAQPVEADAQEPDANKVEVTMACTGAWTVT